LSGGVLGVGIDDEGAELLVELLWWPSGLVESGA
jgi:hypothetical protein